MQLRVRENGPGAGRLVINVEIEQLGATCRKLWNNAKKVANELEHSDEIFVNFFFSSARGL